MPSNDAPSPEVGLTRHFQTRVTPKVLRKIEKVCRRHKIKKSHMARIAFDVILPLLERGDFALHSNVSFEVRNGEVVVKESTEPEPAKAA